MGSKQAKQGKDLHSHSQGTGLKVHDEGSRFITITITQQFPSGASRNIIYEPDPGHTVAHVKSDLAEMLNMRESDILLYRDYGQTPLVGKLSLEAQSICGGSVLRVRNKSKKYTYPL